MMNRISSTLMRWCYISANLLTLGWGCSSVGRATDRCATEAGSIARCGKGRTLLRRPDSPRVQSHAFASVRTLRSRSPCQSSVDYGNTKASGMHRRSGSTTLSQLAFPGEGNPNSCERNLKGTIQLTCLPVPVKDCLVHGILSTILLASILPYHSGGVAAGGGESSVVRIRQGFQIPAQRSELRV